MSLARRLAVEEGKAVLMTLHNLDLAARHADALVVLKGGEIVASGPPGEVLSESLLESVYGLPCGSSPSGPDPGRRLIAFPSPPGSVLGRPCRLC
jgi:iron complex transport system ATP-binding protein